MFSQKSQIVLKNFVQLNEFQGGGGGGGGRRFPHFGISHILVSFTCITRYITCTIAKKENM